MFDSTYDQYRGVIAFVRVVDGSLKAGDEIVGLQSKVRMQVEEIGVMTPSLQPIPRLDAGEVGFIVTGIKDVSEVRVGDTFTHLRGGATEPLPGYLDVKPMVFAGLFPTDADGYQDLRDALDKLRLNDASLVYEPETSQALGFGFRCGFLGLLHMDVVRERLEREFDLDLLVTTPNVAYEVLTTHGLVEVHNPSQMPDANSIEETHEPYVKASVIVPKEYVGTIMELAQDRRGEFDHMEYLSPTRVQILYQLPLAEIVLDFYDQLKSRTQGLRVVRLRAHRLSPLEPRQARHPAQRRSRRRAQPGRAPRPRLRGREGARGAVAQGDPAAVLRRADPGLDRLSHHLARDRQGEAQGRAREVLRRRCHAQAQAAREAEEGQEAHEDHRHGRGAAGSLPGGALARRRGHEQAVAR